MANDKKQLNELETKILELLGQTEGNILDDEQLLRTLNDSKSTSYIINQRISETESTRREINRIRSSYVDVAKRGSILYFVVADMATGIRF